MNLKELAKAEQSRHESENWEGSFEEYLKMAKEDPRITHNAYQRLHAAILHYGTTEHTELKEKIIHYKLFDDPFENGVDAIRGLDKSLMDFVRLLEAASESFGVDRRILLLHGPVGSSKSSIARVIKKGLEDYTRKPEGALYTYRWIKVDDHDESGVGDKIVDCPMHEDPIHLIPARHRKDLGFDHVKGNICPLCRHFYIKLMDTHEGDFEKVIKNHIQVFRFVFSEDNRMGITTFQPKDEKNQDSTELTGDIDYRKIAEYGKDSDPRAFNFDGELNCANRGFIEMIEMLKLDTAFLYDLLTASQEHKIKPKKFAHVDIDEVILSHTNEPEFIKLQKDKLQEALRDRIVKVNIPYVLKLDDEIKIYEKLFKSDTVGKFIAPHTLEIAAMWAILTRLEPPVGNITYVQKMKLYNGRALPGFNEENVKELQEKAVREGMDGISPRYIQDKISNAIVNHPEVVNVNPFMVLNELDSGLDGYSLIESEDRRKEFRALLEDVKTEYEDIIKNEVQRAIAADEEALQKLFANYIDNVKAYTSSEKVKNKLTQKDEEPNESLMRSIEEKARIPADRKDDFRQQIMNYIGALAVDGKKYDYKSNERLLQALERKLFEDQKDTIKIHQLVHGTVDDDTQGKIDIVKTRMIENYGYDDQSAQDVLEYVSSIYARSDSKDEN